MTYNMVARRDRASGDFDLFANEFRIGRLANCEIAYVFQAGANFEEDWEAMVNDRIEGDMTVREMLAAVRACYEQRARDIAAEHAAEMRAENAWARYAERWDEEAQADLALHDFLHPNGYGH